MCNSVNANYKYVDYTSIETLVSDLKNNKIDFAIAPRYYSLKLIII